MPTVATTSSTPVGKSNLDQADYLKLLVTQLTSQNPLQPQSDTAFASELAQFSALQETQNLGKDINTLQANALIGQTVQVQSSTDSSTYDTGVVYPDAIESDFSARHLSGCQRSKQTINILNSKIAANRPLKQS